MSEQSRPIVVASPLHGDGSKPVVTPASSASDASLRTTTIEHRIWLDVEAGIYATVSFEDYAWALQWKWQITWDRHKRKAYATRSTHAGPRRIKLYLHKEILVRSMKLPPCGKHVMGDHGDGDSLNCRRDNLEWATPSQNRRTARSPVRPARSKTPPPEDIPF